MPFMPFMIQIPVGASYGSAFGQDIVQMIIHAGPMVKFVMAVLLFFSIVSWAIIFVKFRLFRNAKRETEDVLEVLWEGRGLKSVHAACKDLAFSPVARLFRAGYNELGRIQKIQASLNPEDDAHKTGIESSLRPQQTIMDNLDRALKRAEIDQVNRMEKALGFLATTGNSAPFMGLLGTVVGIMDSFWSIGEMGSASLAVVAPGIAEALLATIVGLGAAIPAVIAYNWANNKIKFLNDYSGSFVLEFLARARKEAR